MISVVIPTHESERLLAHTLAALVPGALDGILREVIVADAGSKDGTAKVADVAGCRFLVLPGDRGARLAAAAATARADWLWFVQPGSIPGTSWIEELGRFIRECDLIADPETQAAVFRARGRARRLAAVRSAGADPRRARRAAEAVAGIADREAALSEARRPQRQGRRSGSRPAAPARPAADHDARRVDAGEYLTESMR